MTDTELLKRKIHESGLKYGYIAEKVGISRTSLYLKVNGDKAFNQSEISILCELLPIENLEEKEHIFLLIKVTKMLLFEKRRQYERII